MPDNRVKIVETNSPAGDADVRVEGNDRVASGIFPAREADVADNTNQATARNEDAEDLAPNLFKLSEKVFVAPNMAKLIIALVISLKRPVRRRGQD